MKLIFFFNMLILVSCGKDDYSDQIIDQSEKESRTHKIALSTVVKNDAKSPEFKFPFKLKKAIGNIDCC